MTQPVTATLTVAEVLLRRPFAARVLVNHRMHCVGCAIAPFETLAEACEIYGVSLSDLLDELNDPRVDTAPAEVFPESHDRR
jgi:hybrid cluster-associated redox disulfide protein